MQVQTTEAPYGEEPPAPPGAGWTRTDRHQAIVPAPKGYRSPSCPKHSGPILLRVERARWVRTDERAPAC